MREKKNAKEIQHIKSELILSGEEKGKLLYFNMEINGDYCFE